jgi:polysaccharide export outer membrane protein
MTETTSAAPRTARNILFAMIGTSVALSGCSTLPTSGPTARQVRAAMEKDNQTGFKIVDIDPPTTESLAIRPPSTTPLAVLAREGRIDTLGPGDILEINVYEVGITLFAGATGSVSQGGSFNPAARGTPLSDVVVDAAGNIQLPYVGRLNVTGKSTAEVERMIERGMAGMSQRPQALVSVKQNAHNVFYVSGDVRTPGRLALSLPQERILDALARAGGTTNQPDDMIVRVTRDGVSAETRLSTIDASGPQNIALLPGDRVELLNRPRTFLVFGSTEKVSQVSFGASDLSLAEALARIGGPSERTADAAAVFLFRYEPPVAGGTGERPIIYRLNMMRPDSYFLSQRVQLRDKDVIYIASAAANAPGKLATILGQLFTPIIAVRSIAQ